MQTSSEAAAASQAIGVALLKQAKRQLQTHPARRPLACSTNNAQPQQPSPGQQQDERKAARHGGRVGIQGKTKWRSVAGSLLICPRHDARSSPSRTLHQPAPLLSKINHTHKGWLTRDWPAAATFHAVRAATAKQAGSRGSVPLRHLTLGWSARRRHLQSVAVRYNHHLLIHCKLQGRLAPWVVGGRRCCRCCCHRCASSSPLLRRAPPQLALRRR